MSRSSSSSRRPHFELLEDRRMLAVVTVDTDQDVVDFNDGVTSLREAIFATNLVDGPDEIQFDFGHDGPATILLTEGELLISDDLTITGPGAELLTIDASGNDPTPEANNGDGSRIFNFDDGDATTILDVAISKLTLTGGDVAGHGGAIYSVENLDVNQATITRNAVAARDVVRFPGGGGIYSVGSLSVSITTVTNNIASIGGGISAISGNSGTATDTITISNSTIAANWATGGGGINIAMHDNSTAILEDVVVTSNTTSSGGAGVRLRSTGSSMISILGSEISDNHSANGGGGGIFSNVNDASQFFLIDSDVLNNSASGENTGHGGGIELGVRHTGNNTPAKIANSTISGNTAQRFGGGLSVINTTNNGTRAIEIESSTIADNHAGELGGGLRVVTRAVGDDVAVTTLRNSAIFGNSSDGDGGGISAVVEGRGDAVVQADSSTISNNSAVGRGGGIHADNSGGTFKVKHTTVTSNTAGIQGGGLYSKEDNIQLDHSIVAGNQTNSGLANEIFGEIVSNFSLIGVGAEFLAPLADNGGPTLTHALLAGSPAIDAGGLTEVGRIVGEPLFDQRGAPFSRVFGSHIDVGAYERQELNLLVDTLVDESDGDYSRGDLSLREAIELANANPVADTIHFDPALAGGTILLTMGELSITDSVEIIGLGADQLTIDASGNDPTPDENNGDGSRVIRVDDGDNSQFIDVTIAGVTLTGGDTAKGTEGINGEDGTNGEDGGAIWTSENLTVMETTITGNATGAGGVRSGDGNSGPNSIDEQGGDGGRGGGIYSYRGDLSIIRTTIAGNTTGDGGDATERRVSGGAGGSGGGVFSLNSNLTVTDSTISGNTSGSGGNVYNSSGFGGEGGNGGGIYFIGGDMSVTGSQIIGNATGAGGNPGRSFRFIGNGGRGGGIFTAEGKFVIVATSINDNITGNGASDGGDGGDGGGIYSASGQLELQHSTVFGNSTGSGSDASRFGGDGGSGGGIYGSAEARVTIFASTIEGNMTGENGVADGGEGIDGNGANGGGIFSGGGFLTILDSAIVGNRTIANFSDGGGIYRKYSRSGVNSLTIDNSTISGNSTAGRWAFGGGIYSASLENSKITNSTISSNSTALGHGGGVFSRGELSIEHSTITGNAAPAGLGSGIAGQGLIDLQGINPPSLTRISHTIIAGNLDGADVAVFFSPNEAFHSNGYNLIGTGQIYVLALGSELLHSLDSFNAPGDITGVSDPQQIGLAPLADNGGLTFTHALLPGSLAINRGDLNAVAGIDGVPLFDQRGNGFDRIFSRIDIGAYERQELGDMNLLVDTLVDESDGDFSRGDLSLREAIELANANPVTDTIHFDPALTSGTILLTMGQLAITDSVEIIGLGADQLTIDASGNDPTPEENNGDGSGIFSMVRSIDDPQFDVVLSGLTLTGGDVGGVGGAITSGTNLTIEDAIIHDNASRFGGGGVHFSEPFRGGRPRSTPLGASSEQGVDPVTTNTLRILRTTISDNVTTEIRNYAPGGGLWIVGDVTAEIIDSMIDNNRTLGSRSGGGGIALGHPNFNDNDDKTESVTLVDTTVSGNSTAGNHANGGGIFSNAANLTIIDSTISDNSTDFSDSYADGGGFFANNGNVEIIGSKIIGNSTTGPGSWGGGFRFRGFDPASSFTMTTSTVSGNSTIGVSGPGGGAHIRGHHLAVSDSTFSDNQSSTNGGGIAVYSAGGAVDPIVLRNLTISGNRSNGDGGGVSVSSGEQSVLLAHSTVAFNESDADSSGDGSGGGLSGDVQLDHTIVAGNTDNTGTAHDVAGIINANRSLIGFGAEFLAPLADNGGPTFTHALLPGSPAINAGDPELFVDDEGVPLHDQRGMPFTRVAGGRIDIGAYEVQTQNLPGDYNFDGTVDNLDFGIWRDTMGQSGPGMPADGDGNEHVDEADFLIWQSNFGFTLPDSVEDVATVVAPVVAGQSAKFPLANLFTATESTRATDARPASQAAIDAAHESQTAEDLLLLWKTNGRRSESNDESSQQRYPTKPDRFADIDYSLERAIGMQKAFESIPRHFSRRG